MSQTMKVTDPVANEVKEYAREHDMSRKDALARMLGECGYDV